MNVKIKVTVTNEENEVYSTSVFEVDPSMIGPGTMMMHIVGRDDDDDEVTLDDLIGGGASWVAARKAGQ